MRGEHHYGMIFDKNVIKIKMWVSGNAFIHNIGLVFIPFYHTIIVMKGFQIGILIFSMFLFLGVMVFSGAIKFSKKFYTWFLVEL